MNQDKNKNAWHVRIGALGGRARVKTKGFGSDAARASWAGKIGALTKKLGRRPSQEEQDKYLGDSTES